MAQQTGVSQQAQVPDDHLLNGTISKDGKFPPEAGRYHLYIAYACPWAQRAAIARKLKGLDDAIGLSVVHPVMQPTRPGKDDHLGWTFSKPGDEPVPGQSGKGSFPSDDAVIPDTVNNAKFVRDLYEQADPEYPGRYTVPVLWDKKTSTIVNHESGDMVRLFSSEFNDVAKVKDLDLYPKSQQKQLDDLQKFIDQQTMISMVQGVLADSQEKYEQAFKTLYENFDKLDNMLSKSKFIAGDQITEADIRLYTLLIRFDTAFAVLGKYNGKRVKDYENIREYLKQLYNISAFKESTNVQHIKYSSFSQKYNPSGIIPVGPEPYWEEKSVRVF